MSFMNGSFSEGLYPGGRTISAIFTREAIFFFGPSDFLDTGGLALAIVPTAALGAAGFAGLALPAATVVFDFAAVPFADAVFSAAFATFGFEVEGGLPPASTLPPLAEARVLAAGFLTAVFAAFAPVILLIVRLPSRLRVLLPIIFVERRDSVSRFRPTLIHEGRLSSQASAGGRMRSKTRDLIEQ
jgi:hypothetical protein